MRLLPSTEQQLRSGFFISCLVTQQSKAGLSEKLVDSSHLWKEAAKGVINCAMERVRKYAVAVRKTYNQEDVASTKAAAYRAKYVNRELRSFFKRTILI